MRIGLSTPVVVQVPAVASAWEADGTAEDLALIARTADEAGLEFLTCSEHVAVPSAEVASRGAVYWDPLATLGFLAAHTCRIRLATAVLVLGYHHPLEIAKQHGTLDRISGGRLLLGVGIGSLAPEFDLIGADWTSRAQRADEAIQALRASVGVEEPVYQGAFFDYSGMTVQPHALQRQVPIWVGGRSRASLQRAMRLADGWMPFGLASEQIRDLLRQEAAPSGFEVILGSGRALDPTGDSAGVRNRLIELAAAGATTVSCSLMARSAEHYCQQIIRLAEIATALGSDHEETSR
ncbi:LLM class F420-dependent oxidoreductase [Mycolicibacter terrae]|uniref:LLM class F420-dependent oxidoreductase n=2 Tax=Mycolicibacter TaxID=1073531 RepID=A0A1A2Y7N6_MYCSD|nr:MULTISPECIES: LLM class F420-dependent oxidoreductase [Mycolicibacter]OBI33091.1 LLM class F420-dependent oxidoreductase [Mycolicibacter sinensis]RRR43193.1 LLM class F420-dependent oxidoreductase [Mycolicibacter terrae]